VSIASKASIYEQSREYLLNLEVKFSKWVYLNDPLTLRIVLATFIGNYLEGAPVWLLIVSSPSSGKTEILNMLRDLNDVFEIGTFTKAALLSGTPKREVAKNAKGGLLKEIGDFGILICKDFTSVLSMNNETRLESFAALRDIYDGRMRRAFGTDGGWHTVWEGKIGFIGAVTQKIDSQHEAMSSMGERFTMFRIKTDLATSIEQARMVLSRECKKSLVRNTLRNMTKTLVDHVLEFKYEPEVDDFIRERIALLASLVTCARSTIERDGYKREITHIHHIEASPRFAQALMSLFKGSILIGCNVQEAWELAHEVGLSSMPELRRRVIWSICENGEMDLKGLVTVIGHPNTTVRRVCEDLVSHRILTETKQSKRSVWFLTEDVRELIDVIDQPIEDIDVTFPEKSESPSITNTANTHQINRESKILHPGDRAINDIASSAI